MTNALIDVGIHVDGMSEEEAMELMTVGGFQEEQEARSKYLRARLTSTQLSTYFVGSPGDVGPRGGGPAARRGRGRCGGGRGSAAARIAGGLGDTPAFDQRAHMDAVLAHGTPPVRWLRRILLEG